jgi:DNA-binding NarL/FixJ family response regulator
LRREASCNAKAIELRLALIDPRTLVRNAVAYLLQTWVPPGELAGAFIVVAFSGITEFEAHRRGSANDFDVVAVNIGADSLTDDRILGDIRALLEVLSNLPLVLMSDCLQPKLALELLREGIKGYMPATLTPRVTVEALRLVWAGGIFIPPDLLQYTSAESQDGAPPARDIDSVQPRQLTVRQYAVLRLLRQGKPNKIIAAELGITESTVKGLCAADHEETRRDQPHTRLLFAAASGGA